MKLKFTFFALIIGFISFGQYPEGLTPKKSPHKTLTSTFGLTSIEITYGSPKMKSRNIFGSVVSYDKVWRLGADEATTLEVKSDFKVGDTKIKAGKYAMFLIPHKDKEWEFILNKNANQWGAYAYNDSLNVLTYKVDAVEQSTENENLIIDFEEYNTGSADLSIRWANIKLVVPFFIDIMDQFLFNVDTIIEATPEDQKWAAYTEAAEFLLKSKGDSKQALKWMKAANKNYAKKGSEWKTKAGYYYDGHIIWTTAKAYAANGKNKKGLKIAKTMMADENKRSYYNRNKEKIDATLSAWKD